MTSISIFVTFDRITRIECATNTFFKRTIRKRSVSGMIGRYSHTNTQFVTFVSIFINA